MSSRRPLDAEKLYLLLRVVQERDSEALDRALSYLNKNERLVVEGRVGLRGRPITPYAELAAVLGKTTEEVIGIEARALRKFDQTGRSGILFSALREPTVLYQDNEFVITISGSADFNVPRVVVIELVNIGTTVKVTPGRDIVVQTNETETRIRSLIPYDTDRS